MHPWSPALPLFHTVVDDYSHMIAVYNKQSPEKCLIIEIYGGGGGLKNEKQKAY